MLGRTSALVLFLGLSLRGASGQAPAPSMETPVGKVITLLEDLKADIETEGTNEAGTYDDFACFCKDTTSVKSASIISEQDQIDIESATIATKTGTHKTKSEEVSTRNKKGEELSKELQDEVARCLKEKTEYEATESDLTKAVSAITNAKQALEDSKPTTLLAISSMKKSVIETVTLADAMGLIQKHHQRIVNSFLQQGVDPDAPGYSFHAQDIIDLLDTLFTDFSQEKTDLGIEWGKTKTGCDTTKSTLASQISDNKNAITLLKGEITTLETEIATARDNLVDAETTLKDDSHYLKQLTERCEKRARDWDQRSGMRADELEALNASLTILRDTVQGLDGEVNERAAFVQKSTFAKGPAPSKLVVASIQEPAVSFLQGTSSRARIQRVNLRASEGADRKERAAEVLKGAAARLQNPALAVLAFQLKKDPFTKVKTMIQNMIERLLKESAAEAEKHGYCDTKITAAENERRARRMETLKLSAEIAGLKAKAEQLAIDIEGINTRRNETAEALNNATDLYHTEKAENEETGDKAKQGLDAVSEAITILKVFYKSAAKAALVQYSPVDEDTAGAGFEGSYKGNQEKSKGIIGLLEVIKGDFARTIKMTKDEMAQAYTDFTDFDRTSKSDMASMATSRTLKTQDKRAANDHRRSKLGDLGVAQGLLDTELRTIESLKPMCMDNGMSYAERKAKREAEIAALQSAMCALDDKNVETGCSNGQWTGL